MITSTITNITLEINRFRVFLTFSNGAEENNLFPDTCVAQDIKNWKNEREDYYNQLEIKLSEFKTELL